MSCTTYLFPDLAYTDTQNIYFIALQDTHVAWGEKECFIHNG